MNKALISMELDHRGFWHSKVKIPVWLLLLIGAGLIFMGRMIGLFQGINL